MDDLFGNKVDYEKKAKNVNQSPISMIKCSMNYRKSDSENKCKNCLHFLRGRYPKCELIGVSFGKATDIQKNNVCDRYEKIGNPIKIEREYIDLENKKHVVTLNFIHFQAKKKENKVLLRVKNNQIYTVAAKFTYDSDIPEENSWLINIDSKLFDKSHLDINRNLILSDMQPELKKILDSIKIYIDEFFTDWYKDFYDFKKNLNEDSFYPYLKTPTSSQTKQIVFNQFAYYIEKDYQLLKKNEPSRKIIYPLIDKAISNGDIEDILKSIQLLDNEKISKFKDLLKKSDLDEVVEFSEKIAKKNQFLDFLYEIVYNEPAKYIKERSQLHKIIEKELWLFGEEYEQTPKLFSDKKLKNNLEELRNQYLKFTLSEEDKNTVEIQDKYLEGITDLFFFNEKRIGEQESEILIVELKSPRCRITQKEINQVEKYAYQIENLSKFSQSLKYKIILISSDTDGFTKSKVGKENPFLLEKNKAGNIFTYIYTWSDLIDSLRKKLSYMSNVLKVKDREITKILEEDSLGGK